MRGDDLLAIGGTIHPPISRRLLVETHSQSVLVLGKEENMKPGTIVRLNDGREGTVVYHGLDGYGIVFGRVDVDAEAIYSACPVIGKRPDEYEYEPEAMLRDTGDAGMNAKIWPDMECVGENYEIVKE